MCKPGVRGSNVSSRHSERSPLRGCFTFTHRGVLKRNLFWVYVTNLCQFNFSPFAPLFATKSSVILENLSQCKLWVGAVGTVFTSVFNIASSVSYGNSVFPKLVWRALRPSLSPLADAAKVSTLRKAWNRVCPGGNLASPWGCFSKAFTTAGRKTLYVKIKPISFILNIKMN